VMIVVTSSIALPPVYLHTHVEDEQPWRTFGSTRHYLNVPILRDRLLSRLPARSAASTYNVFLMIR
jgi:hypothetical protein